MDISLIEQREIEARMASELVEGYADALGRNRALEIAGQAISRMARQAGRERHRATGDNTLVDLSWVAKKIWARDGALTIEFLEVSPAELRFNVTRCRYAELYKRMDVGELGYYLSCGRDAAFAQGFNPDICMTRTQTIMQGAAFCDFRFHLRARDAKPFQGSADSQPGDLIMPRFFRIIIHLAVFAIGLGAAGFTDFWDWEPFRGLLLPIVAAGFFFYMVLFLLTGEYRIFQPSDQGD